MVIIQPVDNGTKAYPYGHALVATSEKNTVAISLSSLEKVAQKYADHDLPQDPLVRDGQADNTHYRIYISSIAFTRADDDAAPQITSLNAVLLLQPPN